jgi:hypothetical protein
MSQTKCFAVIASVVAMMLIVPAGRTQQPPPQSPDMTFFVTSAGLGKGADVGGLEGADRQCQALAQAAGAGGKTWRAYLSTQAVDGATAVNARDRICSVRASPLSYRRVSSVRFQSAGILAEQIGNGRNRR